MGLSSYRVILICLIICVATGCANIVPPAGGKKDVRPPKLVSVTPVDSQFNARPKKIELKFDEYVTISDVSTEVQISPILPVQPIVTSVNKKVTIKLTDSLLQSNTTYRISFGTAIKDLHEGNVFKGYTYTFSTGNYFDSLQLNGVVLNAVTGMPDTGNVLVVLYNAKESDSAIVKKKPLYVTKVGDGGVFSFKGLPGNSFKIYALKDYNGNLIYDGGNEWIGFIDRQVKAGDNLQAPIELRIFQEVADSSKNKADTTKKATGLQAAKPAKAEKSKTGFEYNVLDLDTSNVRSRTKELKKPIVVSFNKPLATINKDRIALSYDSANVNVNSTFSIERDTAKNTLSINANWQDNTVYTLKLLKNFAKDTSGAEAMPSKYTFRTKRDEDYGKLNIHVSSKYSSKEYVLLVKNEKDTVYQRAITDTVVDLNTLTPGTYTILVIADKNGNGKWDPGKLFDKVQPEFVIPYGNPVPLKAGWENTVDVVPADNTSKGKWGG